MRVKSFKQFLAESVNTDEIIFKDVHGVTVKVNDLIVMEDDKTVGKVSRFFNSGKEDRMEVDFRSHYLELNPMSKFEIIENPDEKLVKAFEQFNEAKKSAPSFEQQLVADLQKVKGITYEFVEDANFPHKVERNGWELFFKVQGKKVLALVVGYSDDIHLGEIDNTAEGIVKVLKGINKKWMQENDPKGDRW